MGTLGWIVFLGIAFLLVDRFLAPIMHPIFRMLLVVVMVLVALALLAQILGMPFFPLRL